MQNLLESCLLLLFLASQCLAQNDTGPLVEGANFQFSFHSVSGSRASMPKVEVATPTPIQENFDDFILNPDDYQKNINNDNYNNNNYRYGYYDQYYSTDNNNNGQFLQPDLFQKYDYETDPLDFSLLTADTPPLDQNSSETLYAVQEEVLDANNQLVYNGNPINNEFFSAETGVLSNTTESEVPSNITLNPTAIFARAPAISEITQGQSQDIPTVCIDGEADRVEFEVAGGLIVSSSRFPYMVSLQQQNPIDGSFSHYCAGTLLTNKLILTASHCVYAGFMDITFYDYRVDKSQLYGEISVESGIFAARAPKCRHLKGADGRIRVAKYFIHPDYTGNTIEGGDIAILEVETPFDYDGPFIKVWPQIPQQAYTGVNVVAGWGATNEDEIYDVDLFLNSFQELRMGILRWMDTDTCRNEVSKFDPFLGGLIDQKVICFFNRGVDGCRADSGGPLLQLGGAFINDDPANDVQLGIVSWGPDITCTGADGLPGLYTNISMYASWVQTIVGQNSQPPPTCTGNLSVFTEITGDILLSGFDNPQPSAKKCCESCNALPGCNAWTYCYYKDGCQRANGLTVAREFCELKQFVGQAELDSSLGITVWGGYREMQML